MRREELVDLNAFLMVAEEQSFTRAAAKLGHLPIGAEPHDPATGSAAWRAPADPDHQKRRADRSRRAAAAAR